jgi:tetratricopeptide (TPR) repeat protein
VSRWERGQTTPGSYFRAKLCELFDKSAQELGLLGEPEIERQPSSPPPSDPPQTTSPVATQSSPFWSVPYPRNPFFTGREGILRQLHEALRCEQITLLSQFYALSGLGGIGKTQIALEYAYRYAGDYSAVFWISAETTESLMASFFALTSLLNLPEKEEREQQRVVAAVTSWLQAHDHWLLIFDNVEEVELVKKFVPCARHGALLFTSRRQALGIAAQILDVEQMTVEEGMRFLLLRSRRLAPTASLASLAPQEEEAARAIVTEMGSLPLALDQVGTYIEETQCSLEDYLQLYYQHQSRLLGRRGPYVQNHPASVITTLSLTFREVEQRNPIAAELLQLCAFLAPDAIPEELFTRGLLRSDKRLQTLEAAPLLLDEAIAVLRTSSLVHRDPLMKTLSLHRLVQAVLQDRFSAQEQRAWVGRIITALTHFFPEAEQVTFEHETWERCERLVSHVLHVARQTTSWEPAEGTLPALLFKTGVYLTERARYQEAEPLLRRALQIKEQVLGTEHVDVAVLLNQLGRLCCSQGSYTESEPLFERALQIREQALGPDHPLVAETLNGLAIQYAERGDYEKAAPFVQRALRIREQTLGADHLQVAEILNTFGCLYTFLGNYVEAGSALQRAMQIREKVLGAEHPLVSQSLTNLGRLYNEQGQYAAVEPVLRQALHSKEQALGVNHPGLTHTLNNLGFTYYKQGRYREAEPLWKRVVEIWEQRDGANHPHVAYALTNLGGLYVKQGKYAEAEQVLRKAQDIREHNLGTGQRV